MILTDSHIHTSFSDDSDAAPEAQIRSAIQKDLRHICITDHEDIDYNPKDSFLLDLSSYTCKLEELRNQYRSQIQLGIGVEIGLQPHLIKDIPEFAASYPFDFIIGSSHMVEHMDPYYPEFWEGRSEHESILKYYEQTLANIQTFDCFDVYGHIDYIIRYRPDKSAAYNYKDYGDILDAILKELIKRGKGIECNTAGYKYGLPHPNPEEDLIRRYFELGGEILTIGSDAHAPEHIAYGFQKLTELLRYCGAGYYTVFQDRKPIFYALK